MKPARFQVYRPRTLSEAVELLSRFGDEAKILAGGQSLVPAMNMRLARPRVLIDINGIESLAGINRDEAGQLRIGALTRHRDLERSDLVRETVPLLQVAATFIGHRQIRNRGTIGGSLAHADPAAELPVVATALNAEIVATGPDGERRIPAREFFLTYFTTALAPTEILTEVRFPAMSDDTGYAFCEVARRHGDFALVAVAATLRLGKDGAIEEAGVTLGGVGGAPVASRAAVETLVGQKPSEDVFAEAGRAVLSELDPDSDYNASAEYRKDVATVLVRRALTEALHRLAKGGLAA